MTLLKKKLIPNISVKKKVLVFFSLTVLIVLLLWLDFDYSFFEYNSGYLKHYHLATAPINLRVSAQQSSGLAFNPENNQLYVIINQPPQIHVLTNKGQFIRKITLKGFEDTEGITYIKNNLFAIISERKGQVSWFKIKPETKSIKFDPLKTITLFKTPTGNTGLEGITYSSATKQLFVVKERNPKKIYAINWPIEDIRNPVVHYPWNAEAMPWWFVRSLSGVFYHPETGHLFILSRRSRRIIEYTLSGKEVGMFSLKSGPATDYKLLKKAEGISISPNGTLYICGEPNQLYIFKK